MTTPTHSFDEFPSDRGTDASRILTALARIVEKLEALRRADTHFNVSGADEHEYRLNSPLSEHEVVAFEKQAGVSVPEEYRAFVLEIGNGGAGPQNGCHSLCEEGTRLLKQPFPISRAMANAAISARDYDTINIRLKSNDSDGMEAGLLELSTGDYLDDTKIVFSGELRGTIWAWDPHNELLFPLCDRRREQLGFLAWYEEWLDEGLAEMIRK